MPKPKENQNKKGNVGGKRIAKRGPSSLTKKKDRLKRSLDRESSQLTISQVEKPEKVDEEKVRKEMEEREEARRIWLQQQRIKYPVAPDGFIPNSIVRSNLQPHVPHPPEKQPEEKTKQLTFLERRMSRLERMNSIDIQLQQQFGPSSEMRFTDSISQSSSTSLNAVDRDRPSSKKKQRGSDVVNDVVTQIRNTSPQLLTSLLELEDIAEVESRLESTPHGSTREREMDRGNGGEEMEGRRGMEDKRGGEEDGGKKKMESRRSGRDLPHHLDHNHHSSVAKQQTIDDDHHQTSATIQHTHGNEGDSDSSDQNRRREDKGLEKIKELKEDGDGDADAISAAADAREDDTGKEEGRDVAVRVGDDGEDLEKYPPSSWKIPLIVEPGDDENDAEEEEQTTREGGDGGRGDGRGGDGGGGQLEGEEVDLTKGKDGAAVTEHDGNFGANHVTGSGSDGASHSDENEKLSQEVEIENGEGGQQSNRGQRVDSRTENEKEEEDDVVKVVNICLPFLRQLDEGDSAAGEATTNAANDDDAAGEEQEADEDESGENSRRRRRRRRRRGIDGEEEWEALPPSYSSFALRPPRLHDDDLDLTSFNSSMAATNASPPTFIELDESQTGAKDDGEINFLDSRKDFPFAMGDYNDERERNDDELLQLNGVDGQQHQQLRGDGGVDENDRFWSSCSNGRLNRRHHNHRDSMDDVLNPSPPLGWHLTWYDRHHQGQHHPHSGSSKADRKEGGGDADGFLPRLLQLASSSSKDDRRGRRHRCEYSILVQKRMHEHISISRYLRTKKLAEILCDFRRPINYNIIKFQYAV